MTPYILITGQPLSGKTTLANNLLVALQQDGRKAAMLPVRAFFMTLASLIAKEETFPDNRRLQSLAEATPFVPAEAGRREDLRLLMSRLGTTETVRSVLGWKVSTFLKQNSAGQDVYLLESGETSYFHALPKPVLGITLNAHDWQRAEQLASRYKHNGQGFRLQAAQREIARRNNRPNQPCRTLVSEFGKIAELRINNLAMPPDTLCQTALDFCRMTLDNPLQYPEPDFSNMPMPAGLE
jgi:cytidylate kinase